ncbi:UBX domain-containing protein 2A [Protopterus annectens]|uniref:UBX domain-containing protein 2A n=1 Tax=Protopterus annectens TaxID=7888 RepID=UPI001CF97852|nr:UBX domain-containing protein 2A [Protopterus annectens]XP_043918685.1 UBX domain-containing protein 2A [Protopterus annectens]XP_043918687.1 UBX domain-containing protein 2A [Protopterus annectens]XP_043918688.1 UBX domain-containing protein 2A [Protopterus annectens]
MKEEEEEPEDKKDEERFFKNDESSQIINGMDHLSSSFLVDLLFEDVQKAGAISPSPVDNNNQVAVIQLWKNGFTVNNSELRSYTDVENREFLDSIKKGVLPTELQTASSEEEVDVKIEDKKNELYLPAKPVFHPFSGQGFSLNRRLPIEHQQGLSQKDIEIVPEIKKNESYVPTKPAFHPFSGQGYRLGSATPRIISEAERKKEDRKEGESIPLVSLNDLEPITSVQIWLADGKRHVQKFNFSHRISHVREFIEKMCGTSENASFILTTSLPFRELTDESLTLEEANLLNAVVAQRLVKASDPFRHS